MKRSILPLIGVLCSAVAAAGFFAGCSSHKAIVIGSKDFSENIILGELLAQLIERKTDYPVTRKLNLGGTFVCFEALKKGDIDAYPEYTGTGLTAQLKMPVIADPEETYRVVKEQFAARYKLSWLSPFGFNNTYAVAVTGDVAKKWNLETVSDLAPHSGDLVFGAEHEFFNREDGFSGLSSTYGLSFRDTAKMNVSLKYQAIGEGKMDATDVFTTDSQIIAYGLKVLSDDKGFFPPYYGAPLVREDTLKRFPDLQKAIDALAGAISDDAMTALNYRVDQEKVPVAEVARDFLDERGL